MKNNIYIGITASVLILIVFIFVLSINRESESNLNEPKIEKLREEYLIKYSEKIKNNHEELDRQANILENTKSKIKELKNKDEKLKRCLSANSRVGTVIDCDLFFNEDKDE